VGKLETLKTVTRLGLLSNYIKDGVDQLSTFSVVTLGPIVTSSGLTEDKVIRSKKLTEWTGTYRVHGTWLKIHQYSSWNITTTSGFVKVDVDSFQLEIGITVVGTGRINTVLVGNDFPELGTNLVTALTSLNVNDFSHFAMKK
jgi:hypothetical protein